MKRSFLALLACSALAASVVGGGCRKARTPTTTETPVVAVSQPVPADVTDFDDFIGRTDAVESVDIKARVSGYLVQIQFQSGSEVRGDERADLYAVSTLGLLGGGCATGAAAGLAAAAATFPQRGEGDLLFVVDPRPYQADYDRAAGQVLLAQAKYKLAVADYARAVQISKTPGAISQQDVDKYAASEAEAAAEVVAAKANLETYRLNLEFCRLTSPVTGKVSRNYLTLGNLVNKDQTLLTTVVSEDPMYAYFDVDENTMLRIQTAVRAGKIKQQRPGQIPVWMELANETDYPHHGLLDFINNKVDPLTGTISVRGVFRNPKPAVGARVMTPGMFVRIRVPLGEPHPALLIADRAIGADQGQKFVYIVDGNNTVQYRRVTTGPLQKGGLRVVEGIEREDWVIVSGLQQVKPREEVKKDPVKMPESGVSQEAGGRSQEPGKPEKESKSKKSKHAPTP